MRVAIDVSGAREEGSGRGRYVHSLVHALAAVDGENRYFLYGNPGLREAADRANFRYRQFAALEGIHVWHFPDLISPFLRAFAARPRRAAGVVVSVHDLIFLSRPGDYPRATRTAFAAGLDAARGLGAAFLAPSEWTASALQGAGVTRERIHVVSLGVAATFAPVKDGEVLESFRRRHGLTRPYLLFVGGPFLRKNLAGAVRALHLLRARKRVDHRLAVVGLTRGEAAALLAGAEGLPASLVEEEVTFLGRLPEGELPLAYGAADALLHPSLAEGFGLPVLEAMACGLPVVAAAAGAVPEVAGDAALLADPANPEELAAAVARLLSDRELYARLRERGLVRARSFTWERTARETARVYRALACGERSRPLTFVPLSS